MACRPYVGLQQAAAAAVGSRQQAAAAGAGGGAWSAPAHDPAILSVVNGRLRPQARRTGWSKAGQRSKVPGAPADVPSVS